VAAGDGYAGAIATDYLLYTWGLNTSGQLGLDNAISTSSPILVGNRLNSNTKSPILAAYGSWATASAGVSYSLGIQEDATLWAWGINNVYQLGLGDIITRSSIVQIGSGSIAFTDSSTNAFTISVNGAPYMVSTESPYANYPYDVGTYGGSAYFDGADDYLYITDAVAGTSLQMGTGDFTIECWIYSIISQPTNSGVFSKGSQAGSGFTLNVSATSIAVNGISLSSANTITLNVWHHVALVRYSGTAYLYVDGIRRDSVPDSQNFNQTNDFKIGQSRTTGNFNGYISDFRVVKGTAVYTDATYTVPTEPLTDVSGTNLLTVRYIDTSSTNAYVDVSAGNSTSAAIRVNNLLYTWGLGTSGQLGDNSAVTKSLPTQVGTSSWSIVPRSGSVHMIGSQIDYLLYGFGNNAQGQLGTNTVTNRSNPILVRGVNVVTNSPTLVESQWDEVSAGLSYTAGISSTNLYTWGLNSSGQIGDGTTITKSSPTLIGAAVTVTDASANGFAITLNKAAAITTNNIPFPNNTIAISLNLTKSGNQKGNSDYISFPTSAAVTWGGYANYTIECWIYITGYGGVASTLLSVGTGGSATYGRWVIRNDGSIYYSPGTGAWAWNDATIVSTAAGVVELNAWRHVAIVKEGAQVSLYYNGNREAYDATNTFNATSTGTVFIGSNYDDWNGLGAYIKGYISNFRMTSAALYSGTTYTVPTSIFTVDNDTQLLIMGEANFSAQYNEVFTGSAATYAIRTDGNFYAWGLGTTGQVTGHMLAISRSNPNQIGNNYINTNVSSPALIGTGSWSQVSAGMSASAAIRSDGKLFVWGRASEGQIGNSSTIQRSSPVQIGTESWTTVSLREYHTAAINTAGELYTWGQNVIGQLGLTNVNAAGDKISRSSPVLVGSAYSITDVSGQSNIITRVGTTFTTTNVPVVGSVSVNFNGTTDYLRVDTALDIFTVNTDVFTIEGYIFPTSGASTFFLGINGATSGSNIVVFGPTSQTYSAGTNVNLTTSFPLSTWSHFAVSFDGATARFFNNGEIVSTGAGVPGTLANCVLLFGCEADSAGAGSLGNFFSGNLSNLRIVKQCLYFGAFTPPTGILTDSTVGTSGANVAASLTGTVSLLTLTTEAATINGGVPVYFSDVSTGSSTTGAVRSDGLLFMWGSGTRAELGNNSLIDRSSPVQVGPVGIGASNTSYTSVNAGYFYSGAIGSNGLLYMWGFNTAQTNFPSIWYNATARSNPTQIDGVYATTAAATKVPIRSGNSSWTQVEAGNSFSSGLYYKTAGQNGLLYTWGLNSIGQLGLNDTVNRSSPAQVGVNTYLTTTVGSSNAGAIGKAT